MSTSPLDRMVKGNLLSDFFNLVVVVPPERVLALPAVRAALTSLDADRDAAARMAAAARRARATDSLFMIPPAPRHDAARHDERDVWHLGRSRR